MAQKALAAQRRAQRRCELLARRLDADDGQRIVQLRIIAACRIRQHVGGFLREHLAALVLVQDRESRRHVGLERHEMQKPLAERVDGVDLEPARRLDRAGKQRAREAHLFAARDPAFEFGQLRDQALVVERHPAAEQFEDADRHVGGGGLGEGQAQDAAGRSSRRAAAARRGR